ncbi:hypothetical protein Q5P01_001888 [Channa striata]|uniref:Histone deacetylase n=1 Tax=Channa striata TaxID=64152 RepID=A0AA88TD94_CHASR|nr:hypothetical protein Q5P01_001888 [Channa striata]
MHVRGAELFVDVIIRNQLSVPIPRELPMDLSVTQRLLHPSPDSAMLASRHHIFLGPLTSQHCAQFSQPHLQYNIEQRQRDMEEEKREEIQQLIRKSKNEQSAVASPLVKQKLREHIIMKSQPTHDRVTPNHSSPAPGYRLPVSDMSPKPQLSPCDQRKDLALRRTVSEPTLKWKLKKLITTRPNPLQRKISAPPAVKHRTETLDCSPSSSTPASGCSSPNDSLHSDNGTLPLAHEAQRLLLKDGNLAHFTLPPKSTAMPNITAGLPAPADLQVARPLAVSALNQLYLPLEGSSPALAQCLQPVLILEPHAGHSQFVSIHGLSSVPLQQQQPHLSSASRREGALPSHRPVERTRSEPPPYSHSPLTLQASHALQQHQLHQLYHKDWFKQNSHLSKPTSKFIEKPRLTQIPSEDMDLEEIGSGSGSEPGPYGYRRRQSTASTDSVYGTESTTSSRESLIEPSHSLSQRQMILRPGLQLDSLGVPTLILPHQPLVRTRSSPASTSLPPPHPSTIIPSLSLSSPAPDTQLRFTTGLVYDAQMQKHQCTCGDNSRHPEHAGRVQSIWSRLHERGLRNQCERIRSRKATLEELQSVHSEKHVLLFGTNPLNRLKLDSRKLSGILSQRFFVMLPCGGVGVDIDTIWNEVHTSAAARIAAGCVTDLALKVAQRELKNGFAVVRPPGHHASHSSPLGFCFFNSVAIAAKQLQHKLNVSKILIIDWDIHHGNGTQEVFYNDPSVLYISLHRYDGGNFFPGSGHPSEVGTGAGEGFNVNIGWTGGLSPPMGDAEYLAAFRTVVMPIAHEFSPDVVLVSAGFDAVEGHSSSLGGYKVTAKCFGFLTRQLMSLAGGRVVLALEGGHDLKAICDASEACVSALLGMEVEPLSQSVLDQKPCENAVLSLQRVIQVQGEFWQSVKDSATTVDLSYLQAQRRRLRRDSDSEAVSAIASLSMGSLTSERKQAEKLADKCDSL